MRQSDDDDKEWRTWEPAANSVTTGTPTRQTPYSCSHYRGATSLSMHSLAANISCQSLVMVRAECLKPAGGHILALRSVMSERSSPRVLSEQRKYARGARLVTAAITEDFSDAQATSTRDLIRSSLCSRSCEQPGVKSLGKDMLSSPWRDDVRTGPVRHAPSEKNIASSIARAFRLQSL